MVDFDALAASLRAIVADATGLDSSAVIPGNDSNPAPNGAYATVLMIDADQRGIDWQRLGIETESTVDNVTTGIREVSFSVQFYRENTRSNAFALLQYHKTPLGMLAFQKAGLSWRRESAITQVDAINGANQWEERSSLTLNFTIKDSTVQSVNKIGSVNVEINETAESDLQESINVT